MKEHNWEVETISCTVDTLDFWICRDCGASGGPVKDLKEKPSSWLFVAGVPMQSSLSRDCDEAKKAIDDFVSEYPEWKSYVDRERGK